MLTVDLYIRVSTDEQADRGYSQRDQEERLRKYCEHNQLNIRRVIYEDHSAKTFERLSGRDYSSTSNGTRGKLILYYSPNGIALAAMPGMLTK